MASYNLIILAISLEICYSSILSIALQCIIITCLNQSAATIASHNSQSSLAFDKFSRGTDDVWDANDEEFLNQVQHSASLASATANQVIENHRRSVGNQPAQTSSSTLSSTVVAAAVASSSDGKKSVKDSQQQQQRSQQVSRPKPKPLAPGLGVRQSGYTSGQIHAVYCAHRRLSADGGGASVGVGVGSSGGGKSADTVEKEKKFSSLIDAPATNMDELRRLAWSGVTQTVRPIVWKLLIKYAPVNSSRRDGVLLEKRRMYAGMVDEYYGKRTQPGNDGMYKQILKDLVRMPVLAEHAHFHQVFARILFIWSMRRPASTYVQGMNDLVTPYFIVYLSEYCTVDVDSSDRLKLRGEPPNEDQLACIEADCYWSLSALLDTIQENFVFPQPGIQQNVLALRKIIQRVDGDLDSHLERHEVEYLQFAFRWMNNLLMREIPLRCIIRLWDTYHSEVDGFSHFHLYVCAAFLLRFSRDLKRESDFQGLMLMLQDLPTHQWGDEEVTLLLAEAFKLKSWFADAPNHLDKAIHS